MAYVWNAGSPIDAELFVMTYMEACQVADRLGWTKTDSWILGAGYSTQVPSKRIMEELEQYRHQPGRLAELVSRTLE